MDRVTRQMWLLRESLWLSPRKWAAKALIITMIYLKDESKT